MIIEKLKTFIYNTLKNKKKESDTRIIDLGILLSNQTKPLKFIILALFNPSSAKNIKKFNDPNAKDWCFSLAMLLQGACASSVSLIELTKVFSTKTRDSFGISRTIVETITNIIFLLASGHSEADKAIRHYRQKTFSNLNKEKKYGAFSISMKFSGIPDISEIPNMEEMIEEFTSDSGKPINWPTTSLKHRLEIIRKKFGDKICGQLALANFGIYSNASEILHGSLYGCLFFFGGGTPLDSKDMVVSAKNNALDQVLVSQIVSIAAFNTLYQCMAKEFDAELFNKASKDYWEELNNIMDASSK